jgi:hypothetical protein
VTTRVQRREFILLSLLLTFCIVANNESKPTTGDFSLHRRKDKKTKYSKALKSLCYIKDEVYFEELKILDFKVIESHDPRDHEHGEMWRVVARLLLTLKALKMEIHVVHGLSFSEESETNVDDHTMQKENGSSMVVGDNTATDL